MPQVSHFLWFHQLTHKWESRALWKARSSGSNLFRFRLGVRSSMAFRLFHLLSRKHYFHYLSRSTSCMALLHCFSVWCNCNRDKVLETMDMFVIGCNSFYNTFFSESDTSSWLSQWSVCLRVVVSSISLQLNASHSTATIWSAEIRIYRQLHFAQWQYGHTVTTEL